MGVPGGRRAGAKSRRFRPAYVGIRRSARCACGYSSYFGSAKVPERRLSITRWHVRAARAMNMETLFFVEDFRVMRQCHLEPAEVQHAGFCFRGQGCAQATGLRRCPEIRRPRRCGPGQIAAGHAVAVAHARRPKQKPAGYLKADPQPNLILLLRTAHAWQNGRSPAAPERQWMAVRARAQRQELKRGRLGTQTAPYAVLCEACGVYARSLSAEPWHPPEISHVLNVLSFRLVQSFRDHCGKGPTDRGRQPWHGPREQHRTLKFLALRHRVHSHPVSVENLFARAQEQATLPDLSGCALTPAQAEPK
jgi:hypothetical protein